MCEIVMLIIGIITLVRGRVTWTRGTEVHGWAARVIGLVLLAPWPLAFLVGMILGAIFVAQGKEVNGPEFKQVARVLGFIIIVVCFILAIGIAKVYAKPIQTERDSESDKVPDIPRRYDEHFATEQTSTAAPRSDQHEVTEQPSEPSKQRDERIQE